MNAPEPKLNGAAPVSLEAIELEFALGTRKLGEQGFEGCVSDAAAETGGRLLFHMPAGFIADCQRVGAVLAGRGEQKRIVLVMLNEAGNRMRVEDAGNGNPFAGLAESFAGLLSFRD